MATWKKVVVSGSSPEFADATLSGDLTVTGGDIVLGTTSIFSGGDTAQLNNIDALDATTEATIESAIDTLSNLTAASSLVTVSTLGSGAISSGFGNIDIGTSTLNAGNTTVDTLVNDSSVAASRITGSFSGSFNGVFAGDGSSLTGVGNDIDALSALGGAGLHQTQDHFMFSDNGTEKKITFSNLQDAVFADVSGDILIAAGGAATIQANSVALATDTTGDYVQNITAGTGLTSTGATSGENIAHSLSVDASQTQITAVGTIGTGTWEGTTVAVDQGGTGATTLNNLITLGTHSTGNYVATIADSGGGGITVANSGAESAAVTLELDINGLTTDSIASGDFIAFSDEGEAGDPANKDTIDDVATLFAGTGLTAASAVIGVDASQTQITSVGALDAGSITSNFGSINNGASAITTTGTVSAGALSVSGNATVDGNLDVNGTVTTIATTNLLVEDRFILMNSGSAAGDGGIIVQTEVASSGSAFVYDDTGTRWGFQQGTKLAQDASTSTPDAYAAAVVTSDDANYQKNGNIRVESGEIYIYIE